MAGLFQHQRWLGAHNAWNTEIAPNQCKTVTELLDYGVRGFALDIYGDDENSLHLQHGNDNPASSTPWKVVKEELDAWLSTPGNEQAVVTLFFESYLDGPLPIPVPHEPTPLECLDRSLRRISCYAGGRKEQEDLIHTKTLAELVSARTRLFAFIEEEPKQGPQTVFPVMRKTFAENMYGNPSVHKDTWVELRPGSSWSNRLVFMNHFGDAPTGSEWARNDPALLKEHMEAIFGICGRYPNFVSLDYINWSATDRGPIQAVE